MRCSSLPICLILECVLAHYAPSTPIVQEKPLITAPPAIQATHFPSLGLLKRNEACQFGQCGADCLSQGAFCCGPAGTLAISPMWGACVTSVRGTTGTVDCYDPDNPSGTVQSCIDLNPTATCNPTDRCFTCDSEAPFCRWETYIASGSPTLRWFSCETSKLPDATFFAATITNNLLSNIAATSESSESVPRPSSSSARRSQRLSTGAIIGIAVGGGIAVISLAGIIAFFCLKKRKARSAVPKERRPSAQQQMAHGVPIELDSRHMSELNSTAVYSPSQVTTPFLRNGYEGTETTSPWTRSAGIVEPLYKQPGSVQRPTELEGRQDKRGSWIHGDDRDVSRDRNF
ncbi:hypothetical protein EJ04DRAFT_586206 [Polyplosphaeria fusca]|uniref:Mid2 domain-containing protein n=1 Tax=Polyplosphaeria fusca TaxID=682080 RepID=A0A9P4QSX6_9PLEO|nr:hypothetical protein EJ04DRAFT_586206 [Polyplosphaeria fusca]